MFTLSSYIVFALVCFVALFWSLLEYADVKSPAEKLSNRINASFAIFLLVALLCLSWLSAIRSAQFSPHKVTRHIGSQVVSEYWSTNNYEVVTAHRDVFTNGIWVMEPYRVTNELWHVWSIFR